MQGEQRQVRSIVLDEGQVDWIMERETPEERLAAWDVLVACAFPEDDDHLYEPPKSKRGVKLSPVDRTKRDAYNIFKGIGLHGVPYGESDSTAYQVDVHSPVQTPSIEPVKVPDTEDATYEIGRQSLANQNLTKADLDQIAEWNRKFPDSRSLYEYLDKSYYYANRNIVCSEEFCNYALSQFRIRNWLNYKTGKPHRSIDRTIHYMALDYIKRCGEIRRAEEEERQKDIAAEFEVKAAKYEQQTPTDIATVERRRRMEAEEKWLLKMMGGEKK